MKKVIGAAVIAAMAVCAAPAAAQIGIEANGARADGEWGGEVGLGYRLRIAPGFSITPAAGVLLHQGENDRYYLDDNGGNERCRDSRNGQYTKTSNCDDTAVKPYGRVEATYSIPASLTVGAGVRFGDDVRPYGTLAFLLSPKLELKGNAGPKYFAAGLRLGF